MDKYISDKTASDMVSVLKEAGIDMNYYKLRRLDEAKGIEVADSVLTGMFKFITDKYNSLDFKEIEASAGDYKKFKYNRMLHTNLVTLDKIYTSTDDDGAEKYRQIIDNIYKIIDWLVQRRSDISYLYKKRKGSVQMVYTSTVAAIVYAIAALISNTIRYVTVDKNADMEVLFDEIPNSFKNIHIKNINAIADSLTDFNKFIDGLIENEKKGLVEAVNVGDIFNMGYNAVKNVGKTAFKAMDPGGSGNAQDRYKVGYNAASRLINSKGGKAVVYGGLAAAAIFITWKAGVIIFNILRSVIFTIFYSREKMKDALEINISLLKANIEQLESTGNVKPKVIANQKTWLKRLEAMAMKFNNNTDRGELMAKREIDRENKQLNVTDTEYYTEDDYGNTLMI